MFNFFNKKQPVMEEKNAVWMKVTKIEDMPTGQELLKYGYVNTFVYLMITMYDIIRKEHQVNVP